MHKVAFVPGKGWPNLLSGRSETLAGRPLAAADRPYVCRLELDTPLTADETTVVRKALGPGGKLKDAVDTIAAARRDQNLPDRTAFVEAAVYTENSPAPTQPPTEPFNIRVETLKDAGKDAPFPIFLRFTIDVEAAFEPTTPIEVWPAIENSVKHSVLAQKIIEEFGVKAPKSEL